MLYDPNWKPVEVKLRPWQKLIQKAIDVLNEHGWRQYSFGDSHNGFCILGALSYVSGKGDRTALAVRKIALHLQATDGECNIPKWNDHPVRTKEEVIKALQDTIAEG